jgi:hypothetical protein
MFCVAAEPCLMFCAAAEPSTLRRSLVPSRQVTRDRLMRAYDVEWPMYRARAAAHGPPSSGPHSHPHPASDAFPSHRYGLAQHKGYPTAAHVAAISKHGATAIHRRTFAPLKNNASLAPPTDAELERVQAIAEATKLAHSGGAASSAE